MKITLLFIMLFIGSMVYSQINEFQFESHKIYPNGKKIAYFNIVGIKGNLEAFYIQSKIVDLPEINRFFIYNGDNERKCMFDGIASVDELFIRTNINNLIIKFNKEKEDNKDNILGFYVNLLSINDFPEYVNTGNEQSDNDNYKDNIKLWGDSNPQSFNMLKAELTEILK